MLKRDYSMRGDHVILPNTPERLEKLKMAVRDQRSTWSSVREIFGQPCWFIQPFVAHLQHISKVRVVIVGGRIAYNMSTKPKVGDYGGWKTSDKPLIHPIHTYT